MDDRRQPKFGMTQPPQQHPKPVETEVDQPGMQPLKTGGDLFDGVVHAAA